MKDNKSDPKKDEKNPVSSPENKDNKDQNSNNINSDPAKNAFISNLFSGFDDIDISGFFFNNSIKEEII